ncbi:hypothetical protein PPERSA_01325 [Pseudocohnilembus persalinus]|uniref:GAF domain-containing protein n=1 Tax=Pseudocohnilembus persalinus TaxID=266149 RepID=A0A0V0QGU8_PSEPJ|nr:hypothetical protein PPERSA_01325 [Pseudocohnilembus persalinus]|eukprot:KRX01422.1 hypothetical protein PPERSA_01325 [Pseudocohnilembus persalinus]
MQSVVSVIANEISDLFFVGFYIVKEKNNLNYENICEEQNLQQTHILEVGPYISTILATPLIEYGAGVCGTGWSTKETQVIQDVNLISNYIACDDSTQSEIVVPIFDKNNPEKVIAVLDIDSETKNRFQLEDQRFFEGIMQYLNYE